MSYYSSTYSALMDTLVFSRGHNCLITWVEQATIQKTVCVGLCCRFIADSAHTTVGHFQSVQSLRFSHHCNVRTQCSNLRLSN